MQNLDQVGQRSPEPIRRLPAHRVLEQRVERACRAPWRPRCRDPHRPGPRCNRLWRPKNGAPEAGNTGVGLYIHTQALDTTTPSGRALFQMLGVFAEFERELITERVRAGMARIGKELKAKGQFTTIGRPPLARRPSRKPKRSWRAGRAFSIRRGTAALAPGRCTNSSEKWRRPKYRHKRFARQPLGCVEQS